MKRDIATSLRTEKRLAPARGFYMYFFSQKTQVHFKSYAQSLKLKKLYKLRQMRKFNKVMVGLDLSEMDETLLLNIKRLIPILSIEKIYFVHVSKDLSIPEEVLTNFPDLLAPVDESIAKGIDDELRRAGLGEMSYDILVKEGNPMDTILRWCKIKDVDLLVMGRKKQLEGSGSLAKNLAQKAPTSVMFIPEKFKFAQLKTLLVPIDFSEYSQITLELANDLAAGNGATVICCHLYEVPVGYTKTGKTYSEFSAIMLENAQRDFEKFLSRNGFPELEGEFILKEKKSEASYIANLAAEKNADLIIIGSRGRTSTASILLGSVSEKLIQINNTIPTLVVKKKGENLSFLDALLEL